MNSFQSDAEVSDFAQKVASYRDDLKSRASGNFTAPQFGHLVIVPMSLVENIIAALDEIPALSIYFQQQILASATTPAAKQKVGCAPSCCDNFRSLENGASCSVPGCTATKRRF